MSDIAIKVEGLSKQYRLGEVGTGTLSHDINRWWARVRGKEDPFLKLGETNDRSVAANSEYVWALQDINFEVKQGEVLGIIGRNGAGKSTLLKILSKTTAPTTGQIKVKGRIASLLEVGTGFHPEMTGRENIFLNGAILGMTRREIRSKFDAIVDFAGVEKYIDTPVKRYSSGMYVRLAFAVAAHLEPEILIVDEVLAVGDAEFQKKCLGKMKDVSVNDGRTVLFVSHNMGAIRTLCTQAILMQYGKLDMMGQTNEAIDRYLKSGLFESSGHYINLKPKASSDILEIKVLGDDHTVKERFAFDHSIQLMFRLKIAQEHLDAVLGFRVRDQLERNVFTSQINVNEFVREAGEFEIFVAIPPSILVPNKYEIVVGFHKVNVEIIQLLEAPVKFIIEETGTDFFQYAGNDYGCVSIECQWWRK
jgi:lipopolysaccharide transport system ATP-binding protein